MDTTITFTGQNGTCSIEIVSPYGYPVQEMDRENQYDFLQRLSESSYRAVPLSLYNTETEEGVPYKGNDILKVNTNIEANIEANIESNQDTNIESNKNANIDTNIESNKDVNIDTNIESNKDVNIDTNIESNKDANIMDRDKYIPILKNDQAVTFIDDFARGEKKNIGMIPFINAAELGVEPDNITDALKAQLKGERTKPLVIFFSIIKPVGGIKEGRDGVKYRNYQISDYGRCRNGRATVALLIAFGSTYSYFDKYITNSDNKHLFICWLPEIMRDSNQSNNALLPWATSKWVTKSVNQITHIGTLRGCTSCQYLTHTNMDCGAVAILGLIPSKKTTKEHIQMLVESPLLFSNSKFCQTHRIIVERQRVAELMKDPLLRVGLDKKKIYAEKELLLIREERRKCETKWMLEKIRVELQEERTAEEAILQKKLKSDTDQLAKEQIYAPKTLTDRKHKKYKRTNHYHNVDRKVLNYESHIDNLNSVEQALEMFAYSTKTCSMDTISQVLTIVVNAQQAIEGALEYLSLSVVARSEVELLKNKIETYISKLESEVSKSLKFIKRNLLKENAPIVMGNLMGANKDLTNLKSKLRSCGSGPY